MRFHVFILGIGLLLWVTVGVSFGQEVGKPPKEAKEKEQLHSGVETSDSEGVDISYCNCRKMRFLGHGGMKICKERFGNLSEEQEAQKTRQCRTGPVQDPLADALLEMFDLRR